MSTFDRKKRAERRALLAPGTFHSIAETQAEMSFEEIGLALGISRQRAEQIYVAAITKLRRGGLLNAFADLLH